MVLEFEYVGTKEMLGWCAYKAHGRCNIKCPGKIGFICPFETNGVLKRNFRHLFRKDVKGDDKNG